MDASMIRVAGRTDNLGLLIGRLFLLMTPIEPMSENARCPMRQQPASPASLRSVGVAQRSPHVPDPR